MEVHVQCPNNPRCYAKSQGVDPSNGHPSISVYTKEHMELLDFYVDEKGKIVVAQNWDTTYTKDGVFFHGPKDRALAELKFEGKIFYVDIEKLTGRSPMVFQHI